MTTATVRRLRLVAPPAHDPPYDDERAAVPPPVRGSLALAFPVQGPSGVPLRLVPPALGDPPPAGAGDIVLPDPEVWSRRLAQAVMEVLAGARTAAQLSPFASLPVLEHLEVVATLLHRRRRGVPPPRPLVCAVHVCRPVDGVAESCAVIETGERRRALALRLEVIRGRWLCTAVRIG